jgi:hypothetical protein
MYRVWEAILSAASFTSLTHVLQLKNTGQVKMKEKKELSYLKNSIFS